jgi:ABC-2 type transport system ATP-binding protein
MADRIGIIQGGKLKAEGSLEDLQAMAGGGRSTLEDLFLQLTGEQVAP